MTALGATIPYRLGFIVDSEGVATEAVIDVQVELIQGV